MERIRREYEIYRLNTENEIQNTAREKTKLEADNKRLRAELTVLQRTCNNMRQERDAAYEEKLQALARSAAFEHDRDKVQRVFKVSEMVCCIYLNFALEIIYLIIKCFRPTGLSKLVEHYQ